MNEENELVQIKDVLNYEQPDRYLVKNADYSSDNSIVLSKATADEFKGVFVRPKFDRYLPLAVRLEIIESFDSLAIYVNLRYTITDCRDPKDNKFLEIALSAKASAVITGDKDLLVLHPYKNIPIINATTFLEQ